MITAIKKLLEMYEEIKKVAGPKGKATLNRSIMHSAAAALADGKNFQPNAPRKLTANHNGYKLLLVTVWIYIWESKHFLECRRIFCLLIENTFQAQVQWIVS